MEVKSDLTKRLEIEKELYSFEYDQHHILYMSEDIEEIKNRLSHAVYFLNNTLAAIFVLDLNKNIVLSNKVADHFTKAQRPFFNRPFTEIIPLDFKDAYYKKIWETALEMGFWQGQISYMNDKNEKVYQWMKIFRLLDQHGEVNEVGVMLFDLSESVQHQQDINRVSFYDLMTNLPNWRQFNRDIENYIRNDCDVKSAYVVMVRLSNLSEINVLYSNEIGDMLIHNVIKRFQKLLLPHCKLYRIVGDVFAIFASDMTDDASFNDQIRKMKQMTQKQFDLEGNIVNLETAFGVSVYPKDAKTHKKLINCAEIALNVAKDNKEEINFYSQTMNEQYVRALAISDRLRHAIDKDELEVYYQPILEANSQRVVAVEGLLRWNDTQLGAISPEEVLKMAEARGMLFDLEFWVMKHIFETMSHQPFSIFINVSLKMIEHPKFLVQLKRCVKLYQVDPQRVILEITEHHAIQNSIVALRTLNELCDVGFKIALDDFGVGYSSVSLLIQFPIHIVKLDRSFIEGLVHDTKHQTVVKSIATMIKNLNMLSVSEGIETEHHAQFVSALGVDYLQGFYYSKPLSYDNLMQFLKCNRVSNEGITKL